MKNITSSWFQLFFGVGPSGPCFLSGRFASSSPTLLNTAICALLLLFLTPCPSFAQPLSSSSARLPGASVAYTFDFSSGTHNFTGAFADYPRGDDDFYQLTTDHRPLPAYLGGANALYISGNNHSDDLFMYFKRNISGLQPNTLYRLVFTLRFASKYPTGSVGVGGSPGDDVWLKAGAAPVEPTKELDHMDWWRMNIDKGYQSDWGSQAIKLGTIAKPDDGNDNYVFVSHDNSTDDKFFAACTDADGALWLFFGTDSGFEATTALYYAHLHVILSPFAYRSTDLNGDGLTNSLDLLLFGRHWHQSTQP